MDPVEIYVLSQERRADIAYRFLEAFAPERSPVSNEFPFPEFADEPSIVFEEPCDLIRHLQENPQASYAIYWNVNRGICDQIMLFFAKDGRMIVGIGGPQVSAEDAFAAIQKIVNGEFGYLTSGSCPPDSSEAFISLCESSTLTNLFEGQIRLPHPQEDL